MYPLTNITWTSLGTKSTTCSSYFVFFTINNKNSLCISFRNYKYLNHYAAYYLGFYLVQTSTTFILVKGSFKVKFCDIGFVVGRINY